MLSIFFLLLTQTLFRTLCERRWPVMDHLRTWPPWICLNFLWGICFFQLRIWPSSIWIWKGLHQNAHHSHGWAPPSNGYGYALTSYGGYVSLSHGCDLPQYGYGYASTRTFYGRYASPDSWICLSQLEQQHHELDMNTNTRTGLFF